jgi:hypothetical protein
MTTPQVWALAQPPTITEWIQGLGDERKERLDAGESINIPGNNCSGKK